MTNDDLGTTASIAADDSWVDPHMQIPNLLKMMRNWMVWRKDQDENGHTTEVLYVAERGEPVRASPDHPLTWRGFSDAYDASRDYDGLTFALTAAAYPLTVVELLDALADDGTLAPWASDLLAKLPETFNDLSPDGRSVRVFLRDSFTGGERRRGNVAMYCDGRCVPITGRSLGKPCLTIAEFHVQALADMLDPGELGPSQPESSRNVSGVPIDRALIPELLRSTHNWVLWGGDKKVPYIAVAGRPVLASSTDPRTWRSFVEACELLTGASEKIYRGAGFVLSPECRLTCLDLDDVIKEDGTLVAWASDLLARLPVTWRELSPSGRGLHVWLRGSFTGPGRKGSSFPDGGHFEMYCTARYMTITGRSFGEPCLTVAEFDVQSIADMFDRGELEPATETSQKADEPRAANRDGPDLELDVWVARFKVAVLRRTADADGTVRIETTCIGSHGKYKKNDGRAFIGQRPDGQLFAGCQHESCSFHNAEGAWRQFREHYEPQVTRGLRGWLDKNNEPILSEKLEGKKFTCEITCPGSNDDDRHTAFVIQFPRGRLSFGCHHAACKYLRELGNHYRRLHAHYEGVARAESGTAEVNWRDLLITSQTGQPKAILANVLTALRYAPEFDGALGFNEFSECTVVQRATPWGRPTGSVWGNTDDVLACEWLQREGILVRTDIVCEAVESVAREHGFHPVREYLNSLVWDRTPRLDRWLITYLGCEDSAWTRAVGVRWPISAVARIDRPGCQADYALTLEGPQGIQKSSAVQELVPNSEWFADHVASLNSKDAMIDLRGKWIIELSEMGSIPRTELERVKAFLSCRSDHYRELYHGRSSDHPRQCVFVVTTNLITPFTDPSGSRRFWTVRCGVVDIEGLTSARDQLWAEAKYRYDQKEKYWLETPELTALAETEQDARYEPGVYDDIILEWVEDPRARSRALYEDLLPWYGSRPGKVSVTDILIHALGKEKERLTQTDRNQVARCLQHAKWERRREGAGEFRGKWFYFSPSFCIQDVLFQEVARQPEKKNKRIKQRGR